MSGDPVVDEFDRTPTVAGTGGWVGPGIDDSQRGWAAQAMIRAEAALAQRLSATSEFDWQVMEALLHAHKTTARGQARLDTLKTDIAVAASSWDLSTAAGAREFQKFLLGKMGEIVTVVQEANDDDSSKQALTTALTGLYVADPAEIPAAAPAPGERPAPDSRRATEPVANPDDTSARIPPEADAELYPDAWYEDDPQPSVAAAPPWQPMASAPMVPAMGGGGEGPGFGAMPAAMPGGFPLGGLTSGWGGDDRPKDDDDRGDEAAAEDSPEPAQTSSADDQQPQDPQKPVTVRLPDGQLRSFADPRLAAVLQATVDGQPVTEAFRSQGIHIPPPGTPVPAPVAVATLRAGDIGVFTDRHALAVGDGKALLDGQVHLVENLRGPGFLGWQHPPVRFAEPTTPVPPIPTRTAWTPDIGMSLKSPAVTGMVNGSGR